MPCEVDEKLAKDGTEIPYVTEDVLLETVKNTEQLKSNLIVRLLY